MVGYQGLSSRASSHRQSGATGRATHTGTPSAPARWATAVSAVMTRSRIAQDRGGDEEVIESGAEVGDGEAVGDRGELVTARALLQAEEPDPRDAGQGGELEQGDRAEAVPWMVGTALPGDADLQTTDGAELLAPPVDRSGLGEQVGDLGRDRRQGGPEQPRQAHQRGMDVELRERLPRGHHRRDTGAARQEPVQRLRQATITRPPRCVTRGA